ncbi:MAG: hypothetical protein HY513_05470 [Candidatus Aenigmarchaeota archaeon]|nr:hypothetical protein [Candidatus Aenigmarchaeota archaeon]
MNAPGDYLRAGIIAGALVLASLGDRYIAFRLAENRPVQEERCGRTLTAYKKGMKLLR